MGNHPLSCMCACRHQTCCPIEQMLARLPLRAPDHRLNQPPLKKIKSKGAIRQKERNGKIQVLRKCPTHQSQRPICSESGSGLHWLSRQPFPSVPSVDRPVPCLAPLHSHTGRWLLLISNGSSIPVGRKGACVRACASLTTAPQSFLPSGRPSCLSVNLDPSTEPDGQTLSHPPAPAVMVVIAVLVFTHMLFLSHSVAERKTPHHRV
ncbi:hypothetical protein IWX90DRAFT_110621 [Phyllosticta citrichinensis]|uniref:Uncharacterized protein n=1 Tax=Phyllosticta citrichinensis TaxID=1130410 RepID=A0ABR1Y2S6_9PEZI